MQELNKGLISIIMLCYSSTRKCMKSKRSQTYKNIKLLFINNSSYEKTKGVLKELASQINFLITQDNECQSASKIKEYKASYILVLDNNNNKVNLLFVREL